MWVLEGQFGSFVGRPHLLGLQVRAGEWGGRFPVCYSYKSYGVVW